MKKKQKGHEVASTVSDERLEQYMGGRYGQRSETQLRYEAGIRACSNIFYLSKTVAEVAREFGHKPEAFRMMMKRHYMDVLNERDRLRQLLKLNKQPPRGLSEKTIQKYEPALKLLRKTDITVRQAAEKTGVSLAGLQQHTIFYHKDLAQKRMMARAEALDKNRKQGELNAAGRISQPRNNAAEYYAQAVELCREHPELTLKQISEQTGVVPHNLSSHIHRWHPDVVELRERWRYDQTIIRQQERARHNVDTTKVAKARRKYSPALPLIEQGMNYGDIAQQLGLDKDQLMSWVRHNHPDLHLLERQNTWVTLPNGVRVRRYHWKQLQEAAAVYQNTDESLKYIAIRFGLPEKSLASFLKRTVPEIVEARREKRKEQKKGMM